MAIKGTWRENPVRFTAEEDGIIRDYYPDHGSRKCVKLLPGRTQGQIRDRAKYLGVRYVVKLSKTIPTPPMPERIARLKRINDESKRRILG